MNRLDLQKVSRIRARESRLLLVNNHFEGSYYLAGYAVECAIKSAIAKNTNKHDFPDKALAHASFSHDLAQLMKTAGLWQQFDQDLKANQALDLSWRVVKDWSETSRYRDTVPPALAKDMYSACTARKNGILSWLKQRW